MRILYLYLLLFLFTFPALAQTSDEVDVSFLTLEKALALAGDDDPALAQIESNALALDEQAVADGQLPDPKASFALQNFPTDNFSRSREGMTQIVVGASQAFPRGKTLAYKSRKTESMASAMRAQLDEQKLIIERSIRLAWFDLYYWEQALSTVKKSEALLNKVLEATEIHYSTGGSNAQDVVSAELELSILHDKKVDIDRHIAIKRAELAKWIGQEAARGELSSEFPDMLPLLSYDDIDLSLTAHPSIRISEAMINAGKQSIKIAEEEYKPGFNVGMNYGMREGDLPDGDNRPDFLSVKLTLDIPLFASNRQDRRLSASRHETKSAQYKRNDTLRSLKAMLATEYANWQRYDERVKHYDTSVIRQASENFEASLQAYQEDRTDFSSLIRAQVMELDARLRGLKLKTDKAKAHARLLYLQGEQS
jgi:outer membrane protein TolC